MSFQAAFDNFLSSYKRANSPPKGNIGGGGGGGVGPSMMYDEDYPGGSTPQRNSTTHSSGERRGKGNYRKGENRPVSINRLSDFPICVFPSCFHLVLSCMKGR